LPDSLPSFWGDKNRLRQVLLNIISNALKFNRRNGKVTLSAAEVDSCIVFRVRDEGRGIDKKEQERLFQPYYRIESDRKRFSGLGLGLALSKSFVELHQGHIWVESRKGMGSTFCFSIPLTPSIHPDKEVRSE
jgi:signal transduction histidine kinase